MAACLDCECEAPIEAWNTRAALTAPETAVANLIQRCKELLERSRTGLLHGGEGGQIRALVERLKADGIPNTAALSVAESITKDEAMKELVRQSTSLATAVVWQPIDTAPKDGSKVDLMFEYPRGRQNDCEWRQDGVYGDGGWYWLKPQWQSQPGLGIDWHLLPEDEWEVCNYPNMQPSHWMRPPSRPTDED